MQNDSRLNGIYVVVADMDRVQEFYQATLGIDVKFRDRSAWCQFDTGTVSFALGSVEEAGPTGQRIVPVFTGQSMTVIRDRVKALGGAFVGERDMGSHGVVGTFADPEGNHFQILVGRNADTVNNNL